MKIFLVHDRKGRVRSVGASALPGVGRRAAPGEKISEMELEALEGDRLHAKLFDLMKGTIDARPKRVVRKKARRPSKSRQTRG